MLELNTATFDETISSEQPVVVEFWAEWCMPCKMFAPVFEELSDELDGKAQFCKLNIDESDDIAQQHDVSLIPTVIIFKNGEPLERLVGVQPRSQILEAVTKHI